MRRLREIFDRLLSRAFAPVDIASIVFFRLVFGGLLVWHVWEYLADAKVATYWLEPHFLFKYYGFSWVHPWPGHGLYVHWVALGVLAFLVAIGLCYRASAVLLCLSCTYFFLLEEARYVNHTYLICLFSFLLALIPAHRAFSVDAWLRPGLRAQTVPAWNLWLLRLQMGVVYFYGGVAKVAPDWLRGEPMRFRLREAIDFPVIGRFFREEWAVYGASYGSLLLDLLLVPLLLWRRTRVVAFCFALLFNFFNMHFFDIGIFPWLAIAATTLFFSPSWPRRALALVGRRRGSSPSDFREAAPGWKEAVVLGFVILYAVIQILVPLRHFLTPGGIEWTFAEHRFSWRMLLQEGGVRSFFYVIDPNTEETTQVGPSEFLNERQRSLMAYSPDICVQFAQYLARVMPRRGPRPLRVEARILTTINGRKLQLYADSNVDLAGEPRPLLRPHWLKEIRDPLPPPEERYREGDFPNAPKD
jgi:vitamin K-dependent gamma-carboxylase